MNAVLKCNHPRASLVPRPSRPAFFTCSMKAGGRPGRICHVMRATADVTLLKLDLVLHHQEFTYPQLLELYPCWHLQPRRLHGVCDLFA